MTNKTKKRYYRENEVVWVHEQKKEATVKSIDIPNKDVVVEIDGELETLKLWEIDKLKYKAKDKFFKENPEKIKRKKKKVHVSKALDKVDSPRVQLMMPVIKDDAEMQNFSNHVTLARALGDFKKQLDAIMHPEIFFARVHPDAIVPTKRDEDAGLDFYSIEDHVVLPKGQTTLVPTGLAYALPKTHYLNAKHERGSTAKPAMSVLAGVIDSGYRGEIFIAINPLHKDIIITSTVDKVVEKDDRILYPFSKAIAQATVDLVPKPVFTELSFKDLQKIESERGDTNLGQSGK
ncbi:dUTPase [Bacillus phage vB_BanS_Nate]|uniref:dUTP diphosphatase n=1 Tax=Bacillus phage vB_BanS_Nate TaxID=2894788 RepID=A0AAE8YY03_9CAUD|nr:dUTPase [Bacillus phage vB_BanS_Nate]UGO51004.1 dUTP diphosphatase [Bacillus phage vB_BanS_Nate]